MAHRKVTGKKAASAAGSVLRTSRSRRARTAAASALSQTHGKRRSGKKGKSR